MWTRGESFESVVATDLFVKKIVETVERSKKGKRTNLGGGGGGGEKIQKIFEGATRKR